MAKPSRQQENKRTAEEREALRLVAKNAALEISALANALMELYGPQYDGALEWEQARVVTRSVARRIASLTDAVLANISTSELVVGTAAEHGKTVYG